MPDQWVEALVVRYDDEARIRRLHERLAEVAGDVEIERVARSALNPDEAKAVLERVLELDERRGEPRLIRADEDAQVHVGREGGGGDLLDVFVVDEPDGRDHVEESGPWLGRTLSHCSYSMLSIIGGFFLGSCLEPERRSS